MSLFRRRMSWLAPSVAIVQVVTFIAITATVAICCGPDQAASGALADCCKDDGHFCPLMAKTAPSAESDYAMQQCGPDERAALLLFGNVGVLVMTDSISSPRLITSSSIHESQAVTHFVVIPTPPPRA